METQAFIETRTIEMVKEVRERHQSMGARPLFHLLKVNHMGINRFEQLLSANELGIERKRSWIKTTNSNHNYFKYNNLTHGMKLSGLDQLWVSDITYWVDGQTHYYLMFMLDVYSRRVLGYTASQNMYAVNNLNIFGTSLNIRKRTRFESLVHHSDKGSQYCSSEYVTALQKANVTISMAGSSLENPYAERLNGIIKNDYLKHFDTGSFPKLVKALDRSVWLYNHERPHSELNYMTPIEFEKKVLQQSIKERKTMVLHDFRKTQTNGNGSASPPIATGGGKKA
jgi:putative transposase